MITGWKFYTLTLDPNIRVGSEALLNWAGSVLAGGHLFVRDMVLGRATASK